MMNTIPAARAKVQAIFKYLVFSELSERGVMREKRYENKLEKYGFGVCQYIGNKMGISSSTIRKYFIYMSFITIGSPLIIYLFTAFWLDIKRHLRDRDNVIID